LCVRMHLTRKFWQSALAVADSPSYIVMQDAADPALMLPSHRGMSTTDRLSLLPASAALSAMRGKSTEGSRDEFLRKDDTVAASRAMSPVRRAA